MDATVLQSIFVKFFSGRSPKEVISFFSSLFVFITINGSGYSWMIGRLKKRVYYDLQRSNSVICIRDLLTHTSRNFKKLLAKEEEIPFKFTEFQEREKMLFFLAFKSIISKWEKIIPLKKLVYVSWIKWLHSNKNRTYWLVRSSNALIIAAHK